MSPARKSAGRVAFVGSGPGDPGLITANAQQLLARADLVVTDPDVPSGVLALAAQGAEVRPAVGESSEVAKDLVAEAKAGRLVLRLVAGDPFTRSAVIAEVKSVARTSAVYDVLPAVAPATAVPAYAGIAPGSEQTAVNLIDLRGNVDWPALAAGRGTLVLTATSAHLGEAAAELIEHGRKPDTPVAVTTNGTLNIQRTLDTTLSGMSDDVGDAVGTLTVTIGDAVSDRSKLSWWESRSLYGWKVLVPRTKEQAGEMTERLRSHGATAHEVPTISVEPPRSPAQMERAVKGLVDGRYQWVIFTSANAVKAVWEKFIDFGLDARAFSGVKIACIGEATAQRVRAFGITPELVPSGDQSSEGLLAEFAPFDDILDPVNRVLLPRADIATEILAAGLTERGWEVDDVTAYRTVRAAPPPAETREMIKTG
ncbi:MAG: uroporphyrinogen-III synthase, partial [Thermocrispum sp.]